MSGAHELERRPGSNQELVRQFDQRLRRLEQASRAVRAGDWVITNDAGALKAYKPGLPPVTLASSPEPDEDTDATRSSTGLPAVMPEDWWTQLVESVTGIPGSLDDLAQYLDAQYYASTHGPGALLTGSNMLWNPDFTGSESIAAGDDFEWDNTVYYQSTGSGAARDQGSAKTVCDGTRKTLRSNFVEVKEGQVLQLSARCASSGLTGGGINLGIAVYGSDGSRTEHVITANVVPADPTTNWIGLPSGAKTAVLSGSWKVPAGVTLVRQFVDTSASAGSMWVDRGAFELGGLLSLLTRQLLWDDVGVLTRSVVNYLLGDGDTIAPFSEAATAAMSAAFQQVLEDLGLVGPDMTNFWKNIWDGAISAVVPKAITDIPGFFTALWDALKAFWNFLFGRSGAPALGDTVAGELGTAWVEFLSYFMPTGATVLTMSRTSIWATLANQVLQFLGLPTIDLPSQLDPTIPAAPVLLWPIAQLSLSTSVPQSTTLYYVATVTVGGKESAPSNEVMVYISPLIPAQVLLSWPSLPAGGTLSLYRRQSKTASYRRVAMGLTGTTYTDNDPSTTVTTQPGSAAASAAGVINGKITATNTNHQNLMNRIVSVGTDTPTTGATVDDVGNVLGQWPSDHVSGPAQTGMTAYLTMAQTLDQIVSGLTNSVATEATPMDAGEAASTLNQRVTLAETFADMAIRGMYAPRPWLNGGDVTAEASVSVDGLSSITRIPGGQAFGVMVCPIIGGPKDYIQICAVQRPTTLTDVRIAVYQLYTDGQYHRIWVSPSSITSLWATNGTTSDGTQVTMVKVELPDVIQMVPGEVYYVELINKNSSGVNMSVATKSWSFRDGSWKLVPVFVRTNTATVTAPTVLDLGDASIAAAGSIFRASFGYGADAPAVYSPEATPFTSSGTWISPPWWRPGKDIVVAIAVGAGGSGGVGTFGGGSSGGASTVSLYGSGTPFVSGAGGTGGASGNTNAAGSTGKSPGSVKYNNWTFTGGDPSSVLGGVASPGNAPGGGSSGAYAGGLYGRGGNAGTWDGATASPTTNYTDGDGRARVRLSIVVGAGGAGANPGTGWRSYNGGAGRVWIFAVQNRDV